MPQVQAIATASWFEPSETYHCPKCSSRMNKVAPIQGLSVFSERIFRCPRCRYIMLSTQPSLQT